MVLADDMALRPLYPYWYRTQLGYVRLWSNRFDRFEGDGERDTWNRSLASADPATLNLLPPTLAAFIAMAVARKQAVIRHDVNADFLTNWYLSAWMERGLTVLTNPTNTLCYPWDRRPFGETVVNSPLGRYCFSCGSSIVYDPKHLTSDSSSDTISSNGRNCYPKTGHASYSLTMESPPVNHRYSLARIPTLTPLSSTPKPGYGKSISWQAGDGSSARTYVTDQLTMTIVETEPVNENW